LSALQNNCKDRYKNLKKIKLHLITEKKEIEKKLFGTSIIWYRLGCKKYSNNIYLPRAYDFKMTHLSRMPVTATQLVKLLAKFAKNHS